MTRAPRPQYWYFWRDPAGRRGPLCRSLGAAVVSAVSRYFSRGDGTLKVRVDLTIALHFLPELEAAGWKLCKATRR
jgi:hypothetical protein